MGIRLDGSTYDHIAPNGHTINEEPVGHTYRGATGKLRRQDANVFDTIYTVELVNLTWAQVQALRASFKKRTPGTAVLDFTDARGLRWLPTAGVDTASIKYGTGVYFDALKWKSDYNTGLDEATGIYTATITLRVNSASAF
jgi:hypothetical protein